MLHLIPTQCSVINCCLNWVDKVSPYVHALWKPQSPCRRRGCVRLAWKCAHSAVCFSSPRREIKETCFPSLLHLEQISSRFLADCWETFEDYGSLFTACFCRSLPGSCKPEKKAARVTDKQHLIPTDLYVRVSFPICVSARNESPCEPCQKEIELHCAPLQDNCSY